MIDISSIGIHPDAGNMDTGFISMLEIWIRDSSQCWKYGYRIHPDAGNIDTGFITMPDSRNRFFSALSIE
jgi:hypothetical protein